jgi:hypothetical protein
VWKGQGIVGLSERRFKSVREHQTEFKPGPRDDSSGACFPICKLSNKLSTGDGADAAHHQLTRQVPQRHVLTL